MAENQLSAEYRYWNTLPVQKYQFISIIPSSDFNHQLIIPSKFMANFRGELLDHCLLRGPSGKTWRVEVHREDGNAWFTEGWTKFSEDHNLVWSDVLVFQYAGNSSFNVSIFEGLDSCEKASAYVGKNDVEAGISGGANNVEGDQVPSAHHVEGSNRSCYETRRQPATEEEIDRAQQAAFNHMLESTKPCIHVTMSPTAVYKYFQLSIPQKWALENLPRASHDIELRVQPRGLKWTVKYLWTPRQCCFRAGWKEFSLENMLEEGDVCVFELVSKMTREKMTVLDVHIFRVVENPVAGRKIRPN